jgi:AcrR family transcriptional regulator
MLSAAKSDMKERILKTADRLFYLQGIRAIGVDTIAAEIGISKRTLYNHFPSKDALIAAYLERRFVRPPPSEPAPSATTAAAQILATFDSLERRFASPDFRGCPFVNAVAEVGEDRTVKKIAKAFKENRRIWFRDRLAELGVTDAESLATQLVLLVDGSIAQDLVRDDPAMARAAKEAAKVLLRNAGVDVGDDAVKPAVKRSKRAPHRRRPGEGRDP